MKRTISGKMNSIGRKGRKLTQTLLIVICLLGCCSNAALAQKGGMRTAISKVGRTYRVIPGESSTSGLEAKRMSAGNVRRVVATSQAPNQPPTTPDFVSLAQYQTPFRFTDGIYGDTSEHGQGQRGSCWAFGGVAALEAAYKRKYKVDLDLSEQYTFHLGKAMELQAMTPENNTSMNGGQGASDVVAHLVRYAIPEERFAPYMSDKQMKQLLASMNLGTFLTNPTQLDYDTFEFSERHIPAAARWNAKYRVTDYGQLSKPKDLAELERTLAANHEIVMDLNLQWRLDTNRNVYEFDPNGAPADHVLLLIGYNRSDQVFLAKNSHGETDFVRLSYDFVKTSIKGGHYIKDVADLNEAPQKNARFLGFRDFDDIHSSNVRLTGALLIRRFTVLNGAEPNPLKLGTLYLKNGNAPLDVTGYFTNDGEGVVLDIHIDPNRPAQYLRFTYPIGFWCYVDRNFAGSPQTGSIDHPFTSFIDGVMIAPRKGTLFVQPGHYSAVRIYDKPMIIRAPQGGVTLGY